MGKPITAASGKPANPFQFGAGQFRPTRAADPGLVYDASYTDYLIFLCSIAISGLDKSFRCPKVMPTTNNLNYPSLAISKLNGTVTVERTVTNVGGSKSLYFSRVKPPLGFSVKVSPPILLFHHVNQKKRFMITVKAEKEIAGTIGKDEYRFGWFTWTDGVHVVRSPMAVSLA